MNLFKENTAYCYCYFEGQSDIKEIDVTEYSSVESIIWHVKEVLSELIQLDADITLFGNLNGTDFLRKTANSDIDIERIISDSEFEEYHNWTEIIENFQEELDNELYVFEYDDFDLGEFTYRFAPENEYTYDDEDNVLTEEGWKSLTSNFVEILEKTVKNYPINIRSISSDDYDKYEYVNLQMIRFEVEPFIKNSKFLLF